MSTRLIFGMALLLTINACGGGTVGTGIGIPPIAKFTPRHELNTDTSAKPGTAASGRFILTTEPQCHTKQSCTAEVRYIPQSQEPLKALFHLEAQECQTGRWKFLKSKMTNEMGKARFSIRDMKKRNFCDMRVRGAYQRKRQPGYAP